MQSVVFRGRLLAGAALGLGLSVLAPQQAMAACTISSVVNPNDTLTCTNTTTTNTTFGTNLPNDRNYPYTSTPPTFVVVAPGAVVDGYGLSFTNMVGGPDPLTIFNDGIVQVNAGNAPTAGGSAALGATATGATGINYSGTGDILNLGTAGSGTWFEHTDTGNITATFGGNVTGATNYTGIYADHLGTAGNITINTAAGTMVSAGYSGIWLETGASLAGDINLTNNADIASIAGDTLERGIVMQHLGTGNNVTVNNGTIGSSTDRMIEQGILVQSTNAASTGVLSVTGSGAIWSIGDGIFTSNAGTGATTINYSGAINSSAGDGIESLSATANQSITVGNDITAALSGVSANSTGGGTIDVTSTGAITSTAGDGIAASSTTGALTISSGVITAGAVGIYASTTDGALSISQSGALTSADIGIDVQASGTGAVTINRTGTAVLTSTGSTGIQADSTTGAINITTGAISAAAGDGVDAASTTGAITVNVTGNVSGGASDGVQATSSSGDITVNVTGGDVTATSASGEGISVSSSGAMSVAIGAGRTVVGGSAIQSAGTGMLTVDNSGTFGTAGGIAVFNTGFGNQNFINNLAGGVMNGRVDLGSLGDTVTNSGTWNVTGSNNFYGGTDVVTNNAGGVLNLATGTFFSGLETLANAGTANLNGALAFDSGDTAMSNSGIFNVQGSLDFDTGTDTLTNSASGIINLTGATTLANVETITQAGRINLDTFTLTGPAIALTNTGTIDTNGSAGLAGFTAFSNAGTIDRAAGTFTAPAGVFTNTGLILADEGAATITGQTSFANSGAIDLMDGLANDTLTIAGDYAGSGGASLLLDVDDDVADLLVIGGAASGTTTIDANLIGSGILIPGGVLLVDAGTSTADAFVIGNVTGNTSPLLDYGLNQVGGDYFLVGSINEAGFAPLPVALIAGEMWYQSAETVWAQAKLPNDGTRRSAFWGQVYAGSDKAGGNDSQIVAGIDSVVDNRVQTDRYGFQIGAGIALGGMGSVGVTGGLERADSDGNASSYETRGWNIGAYGMFGGTIGFHGSFLVKHDRFDIDLGNNLFDGIDQDARSNGVDGAVGYRFGGSGGPSFDFSAGLSHVRTRIDDFSLGGLTYDYDRFTSTRGRIGGRVTGNGPMSLFLDGRVYHEFSGDGDVRLADGIDTYRLRADGRGTWARIEAGIGGPANGLAPMISAWVDVGDVKGFGGRGSFRF